MIKAFPIPIGADTKSEKAIKAMQENLGHLVISYKEINYIVTGIMKSQEPRDRERAEKEEEKRMMKAAKEEAKQALRSRR